MDEQPTGNTKNSPSAPRHRSPNDPGINLKSAVNKIGQWYGADGVVASPRDAALKHMGFEKFTGDAGRALSAIKVFGLVQETDGRLKLTQRGVDIVARQPDEPKRIVALKEVAMGPQIYKDLLREYPNGLPSDATLKSELIASKGFNPKVVNDFVVDFRKTLEFAELSNAKVLESDHEGDKTKITSPHTPVEVRDYVQWESQGVIQFPNPKRVRELSEDGNWAFVDGSNTGVPVKELQKADTPSLPLPSETASTPLNSPRPRTWLRLREWLGTTSTQMRVVSGCVSLTEGPVTIQWPATISPESFEDLGDWLDILKRKIGRSVKPVEHGE